jgi:hypothetical protein
MPPSQALAPIVEAGPIPAAHGVVRRRRADRLQWVFDRFAIAISKQTLSRQLPALGFGKLSARPRRHAQDGAAVATVQKNVFTSLDAIAGQAAPGQPIEVRFQSLPRRRPGTRPVSAGRTRSPGPFDKLRRARRGGRPAAPHDQRTRSAWLFGAICPARGAAAGLVLPRCNIAAMALHLAELSQAVKPGAPAVLLLDQAGWHLSDKLTVPDNITLMPLPAKSPELNPVENLWPYMRDNRLSNRSFRSCEDILDHCCHAWNKFADRPWAIGLRAGAHRS